MTMQTRSRGGGSPRRALAVALTGALALVGWQPAAAATRPAAAAHPAAAVRTAVPAAPVGHLQPDGCTGTGTVVCDLYAGTGTTTVAGRSIPIWGFSSTATPDSATLPGPLLVVNQGEVVRIRLHNNLAGERVSLALPGIEGVTWGTRQDDDTAGVVTGGTRVYTFTADRPGTFLYEAGHTANGARQVAMGLAGALVVLPGDGTAYGAQPAGYPSTAYDDEAVLVLSEIDPKLNADPAAFDMRSFSPRFRLINGKAFPETDPIGTDQGHHVLLRYVNAGSHMHAMSTLGVDQVEVAQDGHPMQYASAMVAEDIVPGQTLDTIVTAPSGPESKVAVYEAAGRLSNDGQHAADPLQLAFGGMLTYLDTNAPPPSSDDVGPLADNITASPQPASGLVDVTVRADLSDATTGGSSVTQAEFVVDDTGTALGAGTQMYGPFGSVDVTAVGTLSTAAMAGLDAGKHLIFVRAKDSAGNWGVVASAVFNLPKVGPQTTSGSASDNPTNGSADVVVTATGDDRALGGSIDRAEYSIDVAATPGAGTPMTLNKVAPLVAESATIPAATVVGLGDGPHTVYVRSHDTGGLWGPTHSIELMVDLTGPEVDAADVGPNPTNGILSDKGNPGYLLVSAHLTDPQGVGGSQSTLRDAEAFLDLAAGAQPAGGSGLQLMAVDGSMDTSDESVYGLLPLSQVKALSNGTHRVYVRGQDAAGTWGDFYAVDLVVDKTAPVLTGALTATPNPTAGAVAFSLTAAVTEANSISAAEYWIGATDPGAGRGTSTSVAMSATGTQLSVDVPTANLARGAQRVNLRVKDLAGNWSNVLYTTVTVQPPNAIFSDDFETGSMAAWSSSVGTGGLAVTGTAALGGTNGLAVTPSGGAPSYLVDATPSAEPTYHAQFAFNGNTLVGGVTTVFQGVSSSNALVLAVQVRKSGGSYQARGVLRRSNGRNLIGSWVPLGTGTHTVRVDWAAATAGTLGLSVDGVSKQLLTADNATLRVETARLGAVTVASTTHGTAYVDSFESTRNTLP
ncbi:MAG TPA: multicopper oxidase domain-containing protein [Angustibacter sp.]|nr:multicopper oxidase domain-containing protein [Angustibacter sp.]